LGTANTVGLAGNLDSWAKNDFQKLGNTLADVLPLICYVSINSTDFYHHVLSYKRVFPKNLFKEILQFQLDSKYDAKNGNLCPARKGKQNSVGSILLNQKHVEWLIQHIKQVEDQSSCDISLNLLYRGTCDGFEHKNFHQLCDNKGSSITVAKVKDTKEILGGYSPLNWNCQDSYFTTKESFIFNLGNNNLNDAVFSPAQKNFKRAVYCGRKYGPNFGGNDLSVGYRHNLNSGFCGTVYDCYNLPIRSVPGEFLIEEVEVFHVEKK